MSECLQGEGRERFKLLVPLQEAWPLGEVTIVLGYCLWIFPLKKACSASDNFYIMPLRFYQ